jgi:hypothetical protein
MAVQSPEIAFADIHGLLGGGSSLLVFRICLCLLRALFVIVFRTFVAHVPVPPFFRFCWIPARVSRANNLARNAQPVNRLEM